MGTPEPPPLAIASLEAASPTELPALAHAVRQTQTRKWHIGGVLHAELRGVTVAEWAFGADDVGRPVVPDVAVRWSCASKLSLAIVAARLRQTSELPLDRPVAEYIPGFGTAGKGAITVRHLLTHTSGLGDAPTLALDRHMSWSDALDAVRGERVDPASVGSVARYTVQTNWFLLAEVIRRCTGGEPWEVDRALGLAPAGVTDPAVDLGSPRSYCPGRSTVGPVRELARLCRAPGPEPGPIDEHLAPPTRAEVVRPWRSGLVDRDNGTDITWGLGVVVDGRAFGETVAPHTFGHLGQPGMFVLVDPTLDLVVAARFFGVRQEMHATAIRLTMVDAAVRDLAGEAA